MLENKRDFLGWLELEVIAMFIYTLPPQMGCLLIAVEQHESALLD
jgi:hypothetical protein